MKNKLCLGERRGLLLSGLRLGGLRRRELPRDRRRGGVRLSRLPLRRRGGERRGGVRRRLPLRRRGGERRGGERRGGLCGRLPRGAVRLRLRLALDGSDDGGNSTSKSCNSQNVRHMYTHVYRILPYCILLPTRLADHDKPIPIHRC